jgi:hypothetical protein
MTSTQESEALMLAKETGYIESLKEIPGINAEVLAAMSSLYRAGWRDCWEAEAANEWDDGK